MKQVQHRQDNSSLTVKFTRVLLRHPTYHPRICEFDFDQQSMLTQMHMFRYILHNSECPATVFSILEANGKTVTLTSDTLFDLLMLKLTNVYKKKTTVESRGPRWEKGYILMFNFTLMY